jgi:mono/diheme cytochrome c family protein
MPTLRLCLLTLFCFAFSAIPARSHAADFTAAVTILQDRCADCHTGNAKKGGLSMNTRETLLAGADGDSIVTPGDSKHSRFIEVLTLTDDDRMPPKGDALTPEQITTLRAWVDAGMPWDKEFVFDKNKRASTAVHDVKLPAPDIHPVDALLAGYLTDHGVADTSGLIGDRAFARRVHLDLTGQLPTPTVIAGFLRDKSPDKREKLVQRVLADDIAYADHWLTF